MSFTCCSTRDTGNRQETRLAREAIRLARVLAVLMPDEPEALGMLALMLLHDARPGPRRRGRRPGPPGRAGPLALGPGPDRGGHRRPGTGAAPPPGRPVPDPGGHRGVPCQCACRGPDRLGADRRAVRGTGARRAERHRGAEPRGRDRHGRRPGGGAAAGRRDRRDRAAGPVLPAARHAGGPAAPGRADGGGSGQLPLGRRPGAYRGRTPFPAHRLARRPGGGSAPADGSPGGP